MDIEDFNARWLAAWTAKDVPALLGFYAEDCLYKDNNTAAGNTYALSIRALGYTINGNSIRLNQATTGTSFAIQNTAGGTNNFSDVNTQLVLGAATNTIEALAGGRGALAFGAYGGILQRLTDQGAPVDWVRLGPIATQVAVLLPLKNAPHPNAVKLWEPPLRSSSEIDVIVGPMRARRWPASGAAATSSSSATGRTKRMRQA